MKVFELSIKVYLVYNISAGEMMSKLSRLIDSTLAKSEKYLEFHNEKIYKGYVFDGLYKVEPDGIYKYDNIYTFRIRTIDEKLCRYLKENISIAYTKYMKVLVVNKKVIPKKHVEKIFTITPIIIKTDRGYWKNNMSLEEYEKRIKDNLIKTYNYFTKQKIKEDFQLFNNIKFENKKPIAVPFKNNISLLGDKITAYINDNQTAQDLAYLALAVGIGENSGRGFGFCGYKYLENK